MYKIIWITPKVVAFSKDGIKSISTTRNNATGEVYSEEIMHHVRDNCINFDNSYDDEQNHRGIFFMFWNKVDALENLQRIPLLRGKELVGEPVHMTNKQEVA